MRKEEKEKRFKRLATGRTNDILKKLRVLSNCSNRSAYEYSETEVSKIFNAIERSVREARSKFYYPVDKDRFRL